MRQYFIQIFAMLSLYFLSTQAHSQTNQKKSIRVTVAPLSLFDPITGVFQVGIQKRLSPRIAVTLDYGLRFNKLSYGSRKSERKDYQYSKVKAEVKYFLDPARRTAKPNRSPYFSFQTFYFPQQYTKYNGWIQRGRSYYQYTSSQIDREAYTFSLLAGREFTKGKIDFDIYIGAGYRVLTIQHQTQGEILKDRYFPREPSFPPVDEKEGQYSRPHVALGLKIGYSF